MRKASTRFKSILDSVYQDVIKTIKQHNFKYVIIERPYSPDERSIDLLAWSEEDQNKKLHLKITVDLDFLGGDELKDIIGMYQKADSKPLIVCEYDRKIDLQDEVIYTKEGVPAVNTKTLQSALSGSNELYIISKKGDYIVRISGEKLRKKREEMGLSLGTVASKLGVTRKAVYEYERNTFGVRIELAEKLIEHFGEDITSPYDIFSDEYLTAIKFKQIRTQPDNKIEENIFNLMSKEGIAFYHAKKMFVDVIARADKDIILLGIEHSKSTLGIEDKAEELSKIKGLKNVKKVVIASQHKAENMKDSYPDVKVVSAEKIKKIEELF